MKEPLQEPLQHTCPISLLVVRHLSNQVFTSLSLAEIGELFKMNYSAVSQAAKRFEQKSKTNYKIREIKQKMIAAFREN
ncbi:hypothetical protein CVT91_15680 [Candidatus Atribacteria bacterium HGW-Atribacteria-1]|nr:MAG: hypothetical protein CVT91_15680 [Candidatus Atribacteria bacterium HGW-Atribacteria-1]PKP59434.1 MAG: hypothetical protein CVT89_01275 [Candidatus Altiarchaeales archaeon HGW-Altiarchaeales-2]